jgi:recombination protein RecR
MNLAKMSILPKSLQNLINQFSKLPGIGPKTASRLAFYLLKQPSMEIQNFSEALANFQNEIIYCGICNNMAETDPCKICNDTKRNKNLICVVEDPLDVVAMAQISDYEGLYHVLGGAISPLEGIGPENLKIKELLNRLSDPSSPKEIILATNPSMEGEATSMYIAKQLRQPGFEHVKVTRLGRGLPMGADLEYADEYTLSKALESRQEI